MHRIMNLCTKFVGRLPVLPAPNQSIDIIIIKIKIKGRTITPPHAPCPARICISPHHTCILPKRPVPPVPALTNFRQTQPRRRPQRARGRFASIACTASRKSSRPRRWRRRSRRRRTNEKERSGEGRCRTPAPKRQRQSRDRGASSKGRKARHSCLLTS